MGFSLIIPVYMMIVSVFCLSGLKVEILGSGVPSIASTTLILVTVMTIAKSVTRVSAAYTCGGHLLLSCYLVKQIIYLEVISKLWG